MRNLSYLFITFFILISGCTNDPPKCSDPQTLTIFNQILKDNSQNYIDNILTSNPPSSKIFKDDIFKNNLSVENIRATAYDEKIKKFNCEATLVIPAIDDSNKTLNSEYVGKINFIYLITLNEKPNWEKLFKINLTYESQLNDKNEHFVVINNLSDKELYKLSIRAFVNEISKSIITSEVNGKNLPNSDEIQEPITLEEEQSKEKLPVASNNEQSIDVIDSDLGQFVESSLALDEATGDNQLDGGKVIDVLIKKGVLENTPVSSYDYHNYYLSRTDLNVLGAKMLAYNHEVVEKWLGCCPNEGNVVLLEVKDSMLKIEEFAKLNKCALKTGTAMLLPDEVLNSNKINEIDSSTLALLACQEDYRRIN